MKFTDDELLGVIEDVTLALGQLLLTHRELTEGLLDQYQTDAEKEKIAGLRKQIDDEREKLSAIRHAQQRKKELERIRKDHEREAKASKEKQTEQKVGTLALRNQRGQVVAWIQTVGKNRVNILNPQGRVVAREIDGRTFDAKTKFRGRGNQGLRILGTMEADIRTEMLPHLRLN